MKTLNLKSPNTIIYQAFIKKHNLKSPKLLFDPESESYELSFEAQGLDPILIYNNLLNHFDLSPIEVHCTINQNRLQIVIEL